MNVPYNPLNERGNENGGTRQVHRFETSSTVAPSCFRTPAAVQTLESTVGSELGRPNPSCTTRRGSQAGDRPVGSTRVVCAHGVDRFAPILYPSARNTTGERYPIRTLSVSGEAIKASSAASGIKRSQATTRGRVR